MGVPSPTPAPPPPFSSFLFPIEPMESALQFGTKYFSGILVFSLQCYLLFEVKRDPIDRYNY